jgi:hypothetical protein
MLLTLLSNQGPPQAGYRSYLWWGVGGLGGFSAVEPDFGVYLIQRNLVIIGGGLQ